MLNVIEQKVFSYVLGTIRRWRTLLHRVYSSLHGVNFEIKSIGSGIVICLPFKNVVKPAVGFNLIPTDSSGYSSRNLYLGERCRKIQFLDKLP